MTPVTDPKILAQLNAGGPQPVTDPAILAQLNWGGEQTVGQKLNNVINGIGKGFYDVPQSIAELGARGLDAVGLTDNAYNNVHAANQAADQRGADMGGADMGSNYFKGGRVAGQIATTIPSVALKVPGLAASLPRLAPIINGGLQGATAAAATSEASDAPLGQQMAFGAAGGAALPLLGSAAKFAGGKLLPEMLGVTTGTGSTPIKAAFKAGQAGGEQGQAFTDAMRGNTPITQVVSDAKDALANMRAQRGAQYRAGMADISKDANVLSFDPLEQAMAKSGGVKNFKGIDTSPKTADVRGEITGIIDQWKGLDPAQYHTPEGFDALKQMIGDVRDNLPYGSPQRVVADQAYNAVRKTISEQAPTYSKVMQDYSSASDEISQIERELSLKPGANPQTTLKKLQSIMRDNANTSWGGRAELGGKLADAGADTLLPQLAGQSMSAIAPRGLGRLVTGAELAAPMAGLLPALKLAPALAASSPRLVGEAAHGLGALSRGATSLGSRVPFNLPNLLPRLNPALGVGFPQYLAPAS